MSYEVIEDFASPFTVIANFSINFPGFSFCFKMKVMIEIFDLDLLRAKIKQRRLKSIKVFWISNEMNYLLLYIFLTRNSQIELTTLTLESLMLWV